MGWDREMKSSRFFFLIALALVVGCGTTEIRLSEKPKPPDISIGE